MEPLTIGIIVCVIIAIILVIYFITKKTPNDSSNKLSSLDEAVQKLDIRVESNSSENFSTNTIFKTSDDIKNNFMEFLEFIFPKMEIDKINEILIQYGSNKTMTEIISENKENIEIEKFGDLSLRYKGCLFDEDDDEKIVENIKVGFLGQLALFNIMMTNNIQLLNDQLNSKSSNDKFNITYLDVVIGPDFRTNNIMNIYFKTNYNENIPLNPNAPTFGERENQVECLTTQLCKASTNIEDDFIKPYKQLAKDNMTELKHIFNLTVARYLLSLSPDFNNSYNDITKEITTLSQDYNNFYYSFKSNPPTKSSTLYTKDSAQNERNIMKNGMISEVDIIIPMLQSNGKYEEISAIQQIILEYEEAANNYINSFDSEKTSEEVAQLKQIMDEAIKSYHNKIGPYIYELQQQQSNQIG